KQFLINNNYKFIYDKPINDCNSKLRPDFLFKTLTHNIILEVDENQHKYYNEICECSRMINIAQIYMKPTYFIRYNPNQYKYNSKKVDYPINKRFDILKKSIDNAINLSPETIQNIGFVAMKQLFYDNFNESKINWYTIQPFDKIQQQQESSNINYIKSIINKIIDNAVKKCIIKISELIKLSNNETNCNLIIQKKLTNPQNFITESNKILPNNYGIIIISNRFPKNDIKE